MITGNCSTYGALVDVARFTAKHLAARTLAGSR